MNVRMAMYECTYGYVCMFTCMHVRMVMYACLNVGMYVWLCMHVYMYACMNVRSAYVGRTHLARANLLQAAIID